MPHSNVSPHSPSFVCSCVEFDFDSSGKIEKEEFGAFFKVCMLTAAVKGLEEICEKNNVSPDE